MKQLRAFVALLILVSLASFSRVMAQNFEVPLSVTDDSTTTVLYFGVLSSANLCIVPTDVFNTHAESMLPPPPPGGVFDARLIWPRAGANAACYDQGSAVDFRQFSSGAEKDTFKIKPQLGTGSVISMSWTHASVANFGSITLKYTGDSGPQTINMLTQTSTNFPDASGGDAGGTVTIVTNGIVVPPPVYAQAPDSLHYGIVGIGGNKVDSVTVSNTGSGILNISAINSSNPVFTVTPSAPQNISAGNSMKFYVTFSPTANGIQTGTVSFTHNAAGSPGVVHVDGEGQPLPLSFAGLITVGDPTADHTSYGLYIGVAPGMNFCINAADNISGHGESFLPPPPPGGVFDARMIWPRAGSNAACFDQGTLNDFRPFTAFGQKDTFKFKAQLGSGTNIAASWNASDFSAAHYTSAHLKFNDGSSNIDINMLTTFTADMTGAADPVTATIYTVLHSLDTNKQFGMAPTSLGFGTIHTCLTKTDSVVISNVSGSDPLVISAINSSNPRFTVSPAAPQSIPSSGSMTFYVTFSPTVVGPQSGTVTFVNNGNLPPASTNVLAVTGTGDACPPCFTVAPNPLGFFIQPDSTKMDSVTVTNGDASTMTITSIVSSNGLVTVSPSAPQNIPSGGSKKFYITAGPSATDTTFSANVAFALSGTICTTGNLTVNVTISLIEPQFVTVIPDSMTKLTGFFFQRPAYRTHPTPSFPNWSNLMQEVVVQGGFQPGGSESDLAGGMRLGKSFMRTLTTTFGTYYLPRAIRSDTAWVRLTAWIPARGTHPALGSNWGALQGTLKSRIGFPPVITTHDSYARGFDSTLNPGDLHRQLLRGQQYQIYPFRSKNKLFAEMVALKFNIAGNDLGKAGSSDSYGLFGGLIIHMAGNPLNGMSIRAASALVDQYLTFERTIPDSAWFDNAYTCVAAINRAFLGPLDTTYLPGPPPGGLFKNGSFYRGTTLHINGVKGVSLTGGLLTLGPERPTLLAPTNDFTETEYGFEDGDLTDNPDQIPMMKLYQNYPNPFNPSTKINFRLGQPAEVTVKVYNVLGQEVVTLLNNEPMVDGYQAFTFDARGLASGVYYYTVMAKDLESGSDLPRSIGKMLLIK